MRPLSLNRSFAMLRMTRGGRHHRACLGLQRYEMPYSSSAFHARHPEYSEGSIIDSGNHARCLRRLSRKPSSLKRVPVGRVMLRRQTVRR